MMAAAMTLGAPKRRLSRDDWIDATLDVIADRGLAAVAVEPLAATLGVTKGSFYSHFRSRDELIEASLERWERSHGAVGLEQFAELEDPAERLRALLRAAVSFSQSGAPSVHVSLLGELGDPRVRAIVARVTEARVNLLARSYRELGYSPARSLARARLAYATYVGLLQMSRETPESLMSESELERFTAEVTGTLVVPA
jgi:AcrR family transcriptional regulator